MKRDVMDTYGYNRNTFADDTTDLPKWFADDETKHRRPNLPITKEAVDRMRERQRQLDARPIKKIMEAKARKKYKAVKKLERLRKKMNTLFEEGNDTVGGTDGGYDPEMGAKLGQISKTMRNAVNKTKAAAKKKVELVVAKGNNRGVKGRPKGLKGKRYKMVDTRMKKEIRAEKRIERRKPKKGRK